MGVQLQRLRQAANLSQADLARAAGVPVSSLRNWEQDRCYPRFDTAYLIARALGISLDTLAEALERDLHRQQ